MAKLLLLVVCQLRDHKRNLYDLVQVLVAIDAGLGEQAFGDQAAA